MSIVGAQGAHTGHTTSSTTFTIIAAKSTSPTLSLTAAVVPKVTCDLPLQGADGVRNLPHILGLSSSQASQEIRCSYSWRFNRDLHRFVWRPDPSSELKDYRMTIVTFGVSVSAFASIKSLQQTARDHSQAYPIASSHVYQSFFYVDDCLAGPDTQQEALQLYQQLWSLTSGRWIQSTEMEFKFLESIPQELHDQPHTMGLTDGHTIESPKALGIHWNSNDDCLYVSVGTNNAIELHQKTSDF